LLTRHAERLAGIPETGEQQFGIYLRISEDREGDELGIDRQFESLLDLFKARGFALDRRHVFLDNDLSAAGRRDRPGFLRMLDVIDASALRGLGTWMVDRYLRNRHDQVRLYESAERERMMFVFGRGADIDMATPAGQIVADILASVARGEIKIKGDRQRAANEQAARLGRPPSGPVPLGFAEDRVTHDSERAQAVREAYAELLAGGTLAGIARKLNAAGMLSGKVRWARGKQGEPSLWTAESVRRLLLAPRNAGLRAHKGEILGAAAWEAIVPEETWRAAVDLLENPARKTQKPTPRHLLSGLARCGCGGFVVAGRAYIRQDGVPEHRYRCDVRDKKTDRERRGDPSFKHVARRGLPVDEWVGHLVKERLKREDAVKLLAAPHQGPGVAELRAERATLTARRKQLAVDNMDGLIERSDYLAGVARHKTRVAELNAAIEEAGRADVLAPLVLADDVDAAWDALTTERQRVVIDVLMTITLHSPGRGVREFDPATVVAEPKR
jgi:DNA invertase Pin-like site-specific DNA recombinase